MNNLVLYGVTIAALLVSDMLLVMLGAFICRLYHPATKEDAAADANREQEQQNLHQDIKVLAVSMSVFGERLAHLENQIGRLQQSWEEKQMLSSGKESDRQAIQMATKMALQGADIEELVNVCGLTRGEAELIRMLHASGEPSSNR